MVLRIFFGIALILSAFVLPWWISFSLSIIGLLYFKKLYEIIAVGIILDSLYGTVFNIFGFTFFFTLVLLVAFYVINSFKKNLLISV